MATMTRSQAREVVFCLLFETEFHKDRSPEEIYALSAEVREFCEVSGANASYIRRVYFGVCERLSELDEIIARHSNGWRTDRIAPVSRSILRLATYEILFEEDVPSAVAMNEAVELTKKFDVEKARGFVNGILNSVKNELDAAKAE